MVRRWQAGDHVLIREIWRGRVWSARPYTVVQDTDRLLVLYMALGTPMKLPRTLHGSRPQFPLDEWLLVDTYWEGGHMLRLAAPGAVYSVLAFWNVDGSFSSWYVNFEEPLRRTALGFDYMDQVLDIIVRGDLSSWEWKDLEDFKEACTRGLFTPETARAIMAKAQDVIELVQRRLPPFSDGWQHWKPDQTWTIPALPPGWDVA